MATTRRFLFNAFKKSRHSALVCVVLLILLIAIFFGSSLGRAERGISPSVSIGSLGTPITQNFDTLATSGTANTWTDDSTLAGWFAQFTAVTTNPTVYRAEAGAGNTGALYSYGTGTNTERALGSVGSAATGDIYWAVKLTNDTGATITSLNIGYTGEQWRAGGCTTPCTTAAQTVDFQYQVANAGVITDANAPTTGWLDHDPLDFTSPTIGTSTATALDGNAAANRTVLSSTITLTINAGQEVWLRWKDINHPSNDHGLAIDDFSVTANGSGSPTPTPSPTATPTPSLSINDVSQVEGNSGSSSFTFTVSLSQPAPVGGVTFNVDTADGTATIADNDYVAVHTTGVTIAQGLSSTTVAVQVNGDTTQEANETFFVNISNVSGASVTDAQGQGTINNDDGVGTSTVVISQVYGGGGNSGATYRNDFIELYNRGTTPVDLTGWSVQFTAITDSFQATSPTTGTPLTTNLSGIIQPGHYYLIQEAAGANTTTTVLLPTPDATGAIAVGSTGGKVALVSNTTVLSGTCPAFLANGIVDFVAYGAANCSETSPAPATTNAVAVIRNNNGCTDTDNNNADFSVSGGPIPRNSSITNTCAGSGNLSASGSANPNSVDPGGATLLTVTVSPATAPPSTGITVTGNLTSIGGSATQQFYDDGTHGDVTVGDNVFSFSATTSANLSAGSKSLPISVADAQARNASAFITMSILLPTCGVERWSVKVGTDPDAGLCDLTKATPVTVSTMRGWPAPSSIPLNSRVAPYETTAWVINGTLINYKKEDDVDYHIVVQDGSGNTVITEVPCPCCAIGSPFQPRIDGARTAFDNRLTAQTFFQNPSIPVRITGIGFFDFIHGQTGVAPNGIELHAILDISFPTVQSGSTAAGSNVTTQAGDVTIRFGTVSSSGTTTSTPIEPSSAGTPPNAGYSLVGPAFNVTTNFASTGPYNVCINVPYITDSAAFQKLKLLHNDGSGLADITTGQNFSTKLICGNSPSLSPFVVALGATPTAADSVITGQITTSTGAPVAGAVINLNGMQNRETITDANGNYRFDNVETNGFYTVTPSRANFSFSPGQRSFSQLGNKTEATFTGSIMLQGANPLDTAEYFVRQHYLDFLGREPDESGFNFWSNQITTCNDDFDCVDQKRVNVSAAYFLSIEFQETGGLVDGLYRASFDRAPKYAEFTPDSVSVAKDVVVGRAGWQQQLAANKQAFLDAFVQRPAFENAYGNLNNGQYVDQLLAHTRVIWTQGERNTLVDGLSNGALTRAAVLGQIAGDQRFVAAKHNEMFVMMEYFGYLRRDPDADGYQFWLNKLNQFNGNFEQAEMVKAFIVSSEYRERFPR
ncbi:MAG: hypothetical protein QOF62_67 [Pyrinomonadaceae bacterium]|jgi:hypothetical protein|nr:hypothetical protein [Pyrinomonadaceae bacterium]